MRLDLLLPRGKVAVGPLSVDVVDRAVGREVRELLTPLLTSDPYVDNEAIVYPIDLPARTRIELATPVGPVAVEARESDLVITGPPRDLFQMALRGAWVSNVQRTATEVRAVVTPPAAAAWIGLMGFNVFGMRRGVDARASIGTRA